jgi:hypothetical protein
MLQPSQTQSGIRKTCAALPGLFYPRYSRGGSVVAEEIILDHACPATHDLLASWRVLFSQVGTVNRTQVVVQFLDIVLVVFTTDPPADEIEY